MRRFCLLCLFITYAVSNSLGSSYGEYVSIGWWGSTTPAIISSGTFNKYSGTIVSEQAVKNAKLGTKTNIKIVDYKFTIKNSKYGEFTSIIYSLLDEIKYRIKNSSTVNMDMVILPNDNALVTVDITSTSIEGYYKHEDKVVFPYGVPIVVEGATVPIRNTTGNQIAFILDCEKEYRVKNAFYISEYTDIVSSTNGRIYFLYGREGFYKELVCYNNDGTFLWKKKFKKDEYCKALQETTNYLYIVGRYQKRYGFYSILDAKTGECVKDYRDTKYLYGVGGYTLDFEEDGFGYDLRNNESYAGTKYIKYDFIKEDSGIGPIVAEIIKKKRREEYGYDATKEKLDMYLKGNGTQKDINKALDLMVEQSLKGLSNYQYKLINYKTELLEAPNSKELCAKLVKTYDEEHSKIDVNQDWAAFICELAATTGNVYAMYEMGQRKMEGKGCQKDIESAIIYYEQAANKGNQKAMLALGEIYLNSLLGHFDESKAIEWFTRAYKSGNCVAKEKLGYFYINGIHVKKNKKLGKNILSEPPTEQIQKTGPTREKSKKETKKEDSIVGTYEIIDKVGRTIHITLNEDKTATITGVRGEGVTYYCTWADDTFFNVGFEISFSDEKPYLVYDGGADTNKYSSIYLNDGWLYSDFNKSKAQSSQWRLKAKKRR